MPMKSVSMSASLSVFSLGADGRFSSVLTELTSSVTQNPMSHAATGSREVIYPLSFVPH